MSETEVYFPPVPRQHYGNPKLTADWVIAHAMKGYSAGLCSQRDARSMAWSQYVKAMGLRPQMDAKDFYKIFDRQWETAYSGPSKIEPSQEPKTKAEGATQWVKVTSVSRVSRVKPGDRNDRSVYFWVNGDFATRYVARGMVADFIGDIFSLRSTAKAARKQEMDGQLRRLAQKVIDEISGKTSTSANATFYESTRYKPAPTPSVPPILAAPPELAADVLGTGPMGQTPAQTAPKRKPQAQPRTRLMQTKNFGSTCPACGSKNIKYVDTTSSKAGTGRKDTSLCGDCGWLAGFDGIIELEPVPTHPQTPTPAAPKPKKTPKRKPAPDMPPVLAAPPELAADVLGAGQPPTPAAPKRKKTPKRKPAPDLPPILTAPPELAADVLGTGPTGLTPTAAPKRKPAAKPKKTAAAKPAKQPKTTKKTAKPKAKKTTATPKLTASQREYLAIQGFVMVKRGGKYVKITG